MEYLTREAILEMNDIEIWEGEVPGWPGGKARVRGLTARERDAYEMSFIDKDGKVNAKLKDVRASLVVKCLIDEKGNRLFKDNEAEILTKKSAKAVDFLASKARELSGISREEEDELVKNSQGTTGDDSSTD